MSPLDHGLVELDALPPGTHQLQIRVPGMEHLTRMIRIESGRVTDLGEVLLREGGIVFGTAVDDSGVPLDVAVEGAPAMDRERPCYAPLQDSSRPGGFFQAELPRDGVLLRVADPGWAVNPTLVETYADRNEDVRLVAQRGSMLTLRVAPVQGPCQLRLLDSAGVEVWYATVVEARTLRVRLLPDTYRLVCRDSAGDQSLPDVVLGSQPLVVEVRR